MKVWLAAILILAPAHLNAVPGEITTVAGGSVGDGLSATAASLRFPLDVFVEPDGSVLIADALNYRIRRVLPSGTIRTLAGTGISEVGDEDIPATRSPLKMPARVSADRLGNVYVLEKGDNSFRKIQPNGLIHTVYRTTNPYVTTVSPGPVDFPIDVDSYRDALLRQFGGEENRNAVSALTFSRLVDAFAGPDGSNRTPGNRTAARGVPLS